MSLGEKAHNDKIEPELFYARSRAHMEVFDSPPEVIPLPHHGLLVPATLPVVEPRGLLRRRELEVMRVRWNGRCADLGEKDDGTLSWTR